MLVLYKWKIYRCLEVTTEAELGCTETCYGFGATLYLLDGLDDCQYVDAKECFQISPNFFPNLRFWLFENIGVLSVFNRKHEETNFDDF